MLFTFLKVLFKCKHKNAIPHANEGYCPDCGSFVRKNYYIVRCKNCGIKRLARKHFMEILPQEKFCTNCGDSEYIVEKYEKLNFVDINYAVEIKEGAKEFGETEKIEIWIENSNEKPDEEFFRKLNKKLLPKFG